MNPADDPAAPTAPETFTELFEAVQRHYGAYPGHRAGCTCLYPLSRAIAHALVPRDPEAEWVHPTTRAGLADLLVEIARRL